MRFNLCSSTRAHFPFALAERGRSAALTIRQAFRGKLSPNVLGSPLRFLIEVNLDRQPGDKFFFCIGVLPMRTDRGQGVQSYCFIESPVKWVSAVRPEQGVLEAQSQHSISRSTEAARRSFWIPRRRFHSQLSLMNLKTFS